ncbi:MAG: transposase [Actinomycetota bacterium]|nr:transposase [Actinomycetota bacterium]
MSTLADSSRNLRAFRENFYRCASLRADALFELTDAILTSGTVSSPPHLSLAPVHRRGWCSLYAALSQGHIDAESVRNLLAEQPFDDGLAEERPAVYAVDVSSWPRCDAESSPERGYYYHPSRHSAGQPIVAGWAYQLVAGLGFVRDSWVAPMDARRVKPDEDANEVAVRQMRALVTRLPQRGAAAPLFVFDAGYDPVRLQRSLGGCHAQILVRLHSGRVFYADPPTPERRPVGRPFVHGKKFDLKDLNTWHEPTSEHTSEGAGYGKVRVRAWSGLHPKTRRAGERYGSESAAVVRGTVVLVEVERLPRGERRRKPKKLWLWWHGGREPDLSLLWRGYVRRFDLEHMIRCWKQALGWTTPRVRHPEQADRWTWLILAAYMQLRLARGIVADQRLPWERPLPLEKLTPTRVLRSFATLLPQVGTPAEAPKPRGRSPGRPKGRLSGKAKRYPAIKRTA